MKKLQDGISTSNWFVGKRGICYICVCVVEFQENDADKASVSTNYQDEGDHYLSWTCPDCGTANTLGGPSAYQLSQIRLERTREYGEG